jgi:GNAT superfamily N-acetyltransferase
VTSLAPNADAVASALVDTWALLCGAIDGGWSRSADGVTTAVSGIAAAPFNGVWVTTAGHVQAAVIESALDDVTTTGLPHMLQIRPRVTKAAVALAARRDMIPEPPTPLMCASPPPRPCPVGGLAIRALEPAEAGLHCELAAEGFGIPIELVAALISPAIPGLPGLRIYVGEASGQPAVTAAAVARGPWVGIFNVATRPEHRRRGYGAAITAHAAADAAARNAEWAWLQSSPAGYQIYRRLGFEVLERWPAWVSAPAG